jgi:hypothetical protein
MLFSLSGVPLFRTGDEDFFWTYGWRMLQGQVFLRDFHQFTPPGADLVYEAVFHFFGPSLESINWTVLGLGIALTLASFFTATRILRTEIAALAAVLCLVFLYGDRFDATHHWFSSLANLLAVFVLSRAPTYRRIAAAGFLLAVATFFTQTAGVMGLLACCGGLLWERWVTQGAWRLTLRRLGLLCATTFCVWLLFAARFIWQAGLLNTWRAQVAYLPNDANFPNGFLFPPIHRPSGVHLWIGTSDHLAIYLVLLFACPYVAILCMRGKAEILEQPLPLVLLALLGVGQTLEVITMLNANRMAAVAMPGIILLVWIARRSSFFRVTAWCVAGALMIGLAAAQQVHLYVTVKLPTGDVKFQTQDAAEVAWLVDNTRPGDSFFEVVNTRFYAPLELRNPTPVDVLGPTNITLPRWVDEVVGGLEKSGTMYIVWGGDTSSNGVNGTKRRPGDHLDPLRQYMRDHYVRAIAFENGEEVWKRQPR